MLTNTSITESYHSSTKYNWISYGFTPGHLINSFKTCHLPFDIGYCADPNPAGREQFAHHTKVIIAKSLRWLITTVQLSYADIEAIHISCPKLIKPYHQKRFLNECLELMKLCNKNNRLKVAVIENSTIYNMASLNVLKNDFEHKHKCKTHSFLAQFTQFNDLIDDSIIISIMMNQSLVNPKFKINIFVPKPPENAKGFNEKIHKPFHKKEFSVSSFPSNTTIDYDTFIGKPIKNPHNIKIKCRAKATIHSCNNAELAPTLQGSFVYDTHFPAPPVCSNNSNIFSKLFGIIYKAEDNNLHTKPISFFEYCNMFIMEYAITSKFSSNTKNIELLENSIPAKTSAFVYNKISNILQSITKEHQNYSVETIPDVAPAAFTNVLTNSVIHHKLPSDSTWQQAIKKDIECNLILQMLKNPALITTENLQKIHHALRAPLRQSLLYEENDIIFIEDRIPSRNTTVSLKLVPESLKNIVFIAFYSNPIGGHLHLYQTLHRIRLRFYWPRMVPYIKHMIYKCPGCQMANATINRKNVHLYSFPIDVPFRTVHVDIYTMGKTESFDGYKTLFILLDHMTSFAVVEPLSQTQLRFIFQSNDENSTQTRPMSYSNSGCR